MRESDSQTAPRYGEVVTHGKAVGIATPFNERIVDAVWSISKGMKSSRETLDLVRERIDVACVARSARRTSGHAADRMAKPTVRSRS